MWSFSFRKVAIFLFQAWHICFILYDILKSIYIVSYRNGKIQYEENSGSFSLQKKYTNIYNKITHKNLHDLHLSHNQMLS